MGEDICPSIEYEPDGQSSVFGGVSGETGIEKSAENFFVCVMDRRFLSLALSRGALQPVLCFDGRPVFGEQWSKY